MCFWILKLKVNNQIHIYNITEQEEHGDSGVTYWNSILLRVVALFILKYDLFQVWREVLQVAHVESWAHCQPLQWKYNIRNILTALFKTQHQHWIKLHMHFSSTDHRIRPHGVKAVRLLLATTLIAIKETGVSFSTKWHFFARILYWRPEARNSRDYCNHTSHLFRCWIADTFLWHPPSNCVHCLDLLCCWGLPTLSLGCLSLFQSYNSHYIYFRSLDWNNLHLKWSEAYNRKAVIVVNICCISDV